MIRILDNFQTSRRRRAPRGMALLLVMVAMVVGMMLAASYLQVQQTAVGMLQGGNDSAQGRAIATSGIKMCIDMIATDTPGWLQFAPGTWINNMQLCGGTVTVTAAPADGSEINSFLQEPTGTVLFTATAVYHGATYAEQAWVSPTGGGNVFQDGTFAANGMNMNGHTLIDAYSGTYVRNSSYAPLLTLGVYSQLPNGNNFTFNSAASMANATVQINSPPPGEGGYNMLDLLYGTDYLVQPVGGNARPPAAPTIPGQVLNDNLNGLASGGILFGNNWRLSGSYSQVAVRAGPVVTLSAGSGPIEVGNLSIAGSLVIASNQNVTIHVTGNTTISGHITLDSGATLTLICGNGVSLNRANVNVGGNPAAVTIEAMGNGPAVQVTGGADVGGTIFAPQSTVTIGSSTSDRSQLFGAVVSSTLIMNGYAQLHYDTALATGTALHDIAGGTWNGDYTVRWNYGLGGVQP